MVQIYSHHQRSGGYIEEWTAELDKQHRHVNAGAHTTSTLAKRPAPSSSANGPAAKKVKSEPSDDGINDEHMKKLYKSRQVDTLKVSELKEWLKAKGIETSGRKADLVERVDAFWEDK
jgi:ATP-dependent DNA helicase 2 subunit 1